MDLTEDELRRVKTNLHELPVRAGYGNIARGRLQKADAWDLSDLLVNHYTEDYAVEVAAEALRASNCRRQAEKLLKATAGKDAGSSVQNPMSPSCSPEKVAAQAVVLQEMHFIERHREALIQRTVMVEGILDKLHGIVLDEEQYQKILSKGSTPDKMRELYNLVPSWNRFCKDKLYEALREKNKFLIEDLEGQ